MAKNILRTGKKVRPKTAIHGKRYRCASCRKRSPKPVKTPARRGPHRLVTTKTQNKPHKQTTQGNDALGC